LAAFEELEMVTQPRTYDQGEAVPTRQIRRFDVFAEYNRQRNLRKGMPDAYAKGEALWVAKVVASRGGGVRSRLHHADAAHEAPGASSKDEDRGPERWSFKTLDGQAQTDALFDNEIVKRMGRTFYEQVFEPAIERAVAEGSRYEDIRDTLRTRWNATRRGRNAA
jgi:hypothetical protein